MIPASAFILIGGKSKRFGSPKWEALLQGQSILDRLWDAAGDFQKRTIIGKKEPPGLDKPFIKDELELNAPINGLYTALKHTPTDWIFLLSCDLPLITGDVFKELWKSKSEAIDSIIPVANDRHQGTAAFYHKRILGTVESAIKQSDFSLYSLTNEIKIMETDFGNDGRFWNMNTKKDYEEIIAHISKKN